MKTCTECGIEIEDNSQGRRRKTCSRRCRDKRYARIVKENTPKVFVQCRVCSKEFERGDRLVYCSETCRYEAAIEYARNKWREQQQGKPDFKELPCSWCNKPVIVRKGFPGLKATHPDCKKERIRARNKTKNTRRRTYQAVTHRVSIEQIGDRDKWTCHICSEHVDPYLPGNHREGGTYDHVIPLSKGGSDQVDNLKLAHWICNVRKSNKVENAKSR